MRMIAGRQENKYRNVRQRHTNIHKYVTISNKPPMTRKQATN